MSRPPPFDVWDKIVLAFCLIALSFLVSGATVAGAVQVSGWVAVLAGYRT